MPDPTNRLIEAARKVVRTFVPYVTAWEEREPRSPIDLTKLYEELRSALEAAEKPPKPE